MNGLNERRAHFAFPHQRLPQPRRQFKLNAGAGVQLELPARLRQALVRESEMRAAFVETVHATLAAYGYDAG